jgi:hypothetical protein
MDWTGLAAQAKPSGQRAVALDRLGLLVESICGCQGILSTVIVCILLCTQQEGYVTTL